MSGLIEDIKKVLDKCQRVFRLYGGTPHRIACEDETVESQLDALLQRLTALDKPDDAEELRSLLVTPEGDAGRIIRAAADSMDALRLERDQLREACREAIDIIHIWHGEGEEWDIYYEHSPEMKRLRAALSGQEAKT